MVRSFISLLVAFVSLAGPARAQNRDSLPPHVSGDFKLHTFGGENGTLAVIPVDG